MLTKPRESRILVHVGRRYHTNAQGDALETVFNVDATTNMDVRRRGEKRGVSPIKKRNKNATCPVARIGVNLMQSIFDGSSIYHLASHRYNGS